MKTKPQVWVPAGAVLLLGALWVLGLLTVGPRPPVYRGHALSDWLNGKMFSRGAPASEMTAVLRSVGSEALPWLVQSFEVYNRNYTNKLLLAQYVRLYFAASPRVRRLLPDPPVLRSQIARYNALQLLGRLAPGTSYEDRVLRDLLSADAPGDAEFAKSRLLALGRFTNSPALVIPALLGGITNPATFQASVEALRPFRELATTELSKTATRESGYVRPAGLALEKINPDAYHNLLQETHR